MKMCTRPAIIVALFAFGIGGCGGATIREVPRTVQPGAPGEATRVRDVSAAGATRSVGYTAADVLFMQGMIHHHGQAIEMTSLVEDRTTNQAIRLLARRIELSQEDEMSLMRRWLQRRGEAVPDLHVGGGHHGGSDPTLEPGMLTEHQLSQLAAATGEAFDRLFLEFMIYHHEGALVMVRELFESDGAGQEGEIFQFASHVDSDQRTEIDRMRLMLDAL